MFKSNSRASEIDHQSHSELSVRDDARTQAHRARRQSRTTSATSGDETRREVSEAFSQPQIPRHRTRTSSNASNVASLNNSTTVVVENETKPIRKKKTFKKREGEEIEMTERKSSGSRRRRKPASKEGYSEPETTTDDRDDRILGIVVHRTSRLKTDLRVRHPFVRVHLIDLNTRSYVRTTDPNRLTLCYHIENDQPRDHIPGISTDPFDFNTNRSTIPLWEQLLIINERYAQFTSTDQPNIYVFFEILESIKTQADTNDLSSVFPIAWGFLKIIGAQNTLNTERMMRLQLWEPVQYQRSSASLTPDVVLWFQHTSRVKYPSTIYVTIKPLDKPTHYHPGLRTAVGGNIENVRDMYERINADNTVLNPDGSSNVIGDSKFGANNLNIGPLQRVAQLPPPWQKLPNTKCKVPTEKLLALETSEDGCSSIRFSHNGYFLACALVNKAQQKNFISIFEIPRGQRVVLFSGHLQMIYDMDWSRSDRYLASASADSLVKIWDFENTQPKPWRTLPHPNYVYCVRFHPFAEDTVVTAGYDKMIRIWKLDNKHETIIRTMADHLGYISCLSFNPDGTRLASVDSEGAIKIWHGLPNEKSSSHKFADSWSLEFNLDFVDLQNVPLNSVMYSPGDSYLLVSGCDNVTVLIDIRTKSISRRYVGSFNIQDRIRSSFSTCGTLVFSGSEDRQVHCWNTYNENLVFSFKTLNYARPVTDIQFHPYDNIIAMCSIGPSQQVYLFQHTFKDADIEAKPLERHNPKPGRIVPMKTSMVTSDTERKSNRSMTDRYEDSGRQTAGSDTERYMTDEQRGNNSDDLARALTTKNDKRNRRLAVVNKILDEMDDVIKSKPASNRHRESLSDYGGGHIMSRSTERDVSPYRGRRSIPTSDYNSDSGRPPIVSPLRNLTSPDLFVPASNKTDNDDYIPKKSSNSSNQIMYATVDYKAKRPEELSFSKNDKIIILKRESYLLWYAEHVQTGTRGYVSPNRVHIVAKESYSHAQKSTTSVQNSHSISDIPRLDNSSRRLQQKSVKFDSSD